MSTESPSFVELSAAPSRRKINKYTVLERKAHCAAWQKSGLSMREYCQKSGLLISTLSQWIKKYSDKLTKALPDKLEKSPVSLGQGSMEIILISGIRLRFAGIRSIAEILKLIQALESCN